MDTLRGGTDLYRLDCEILENLLAEIPDQKDLGSSAPDLLQPYESWIDAQLSRLETWGAEIDVDSLILDTIRDSTGSDDGLHYSTTTCLVSIYREASLVIGQLIPYRESVAESYQKKVSPSRTVSMEAEASQLRAALRNIDHYITELFQLIDGIRTFSAFHRNSGPNVAILDTVKCITASGQDSLTRLQGSPIESGRLDNPEVIKDLLHKKADANTKAEVKQLVAEKMIFGHPSNVQPFKSPLEEKRACLRSLSFPNIGARHQDIAYAHQDTCGWLFQTTQFQQWQDRGKLISHNGVLWIKGTPGVGKSTLMKHTLGYCREIFKDHVIAAYFFNARGTTLERTPLGMLRSLLYQLLEQDPDLCVRFIPIFRDKLKKFETWEWREVELTEFLLSEIKTCRSKPLLLIDALDECNEQEVRKVVSFLESLSINAIGAETSLNICLSSRHYPNINMDKKLELIVEGQKEHDQDIVKYVQDKLRIRDRKIEEELLKKAAGVFMWVVLVVEMLNQAYDDVTVSAVRKKLYEVPSGLDELFETLLDKDDPDKRATLLMLQWVLFSRRLLEPEELYFAVLAGTEIEKLGPWDRSIETSEVIKRYIISKSKGLIEIHQWHSETVQLIHRSVSDFLLRNKRLQTVDPTLGLDTLSTSNGRLRDCCFSYLMSKEMPVPEDMSDLKELGLSYPFLEYASTYVLDHAEEAQAGSIVQKDFMQRLQQSLEEFERLKRFHNAFEDYPDFGCDSAELLYILSLHGYHKLVKIALLKSGVDVNAQREGYGNALQAASQSGSEEIVAMLLEKGADVNAQGGDYGNALQAASQSGSEEIVAMLLEKGADFNAQGGAYGNALQAASYRKHEGIVRMLLEKGADVNAQGGDYGNALRAASQSGSEEIVAMLLEKGADVNAQGGDYGNALQAASYRKHKGIVRMLLEKGADVNAQGGDYGNALQAASLSGGDEIMALLLEKGADVNTLGGDYGNALQAASYRKHKGIVRMLLEKGAGVNAQGGVHGNALQAASLSGSEEIVAMLLEKGADVNAQGGAYGNALQAASWSGSEEIVTMLLEKGADVNAEGGVYGNALQAALYGENREIVAMLLGKEADVNAQGGVLGNAAEDDVEPEPSQRQKWRSTPSKQQKRDRKLRYLLGSEATIGEGR